MKKLFVSLALAVVATAVFAQATPKHCPKKADCPKACKDCPKADKADKADKAGCTCQKDCPKKADGPKAEKG